MESFAGCSGGRWGANVSRGSVKIRETKKTHGFIGAIINIEVDGALMIDALSRIDNVKGNRKCNYTKNLRGE